MGSAQAQVDLAPFLKQEQVGELKLSPTAEFYAATVPLADRTEPPRESRRLHYLRRWSHEQSKQV
ncbi:hypothetical protein, partial [Xanthomonas graminis]|uniref:hypothetical protein n=1 Tax=Xanthomonas graminis TaxID=3390026 RepID=UPI00148057E3